MKIKYLINQEGASPVYMLCASHRAHFSTCVKRYTSVLRSCDLLRFHTKWYTKHKSIRYIFSMIAIVWTAFAKTVREPCRVLCAFSLCVFMCTRSQSYSQLNALRCLFFFLIIFLFLFSCNVLNAIHSFCLTTKSPLFTIFSIYLPLMILCLH